MLPCALGHHPLCPQLGPRPVTFSMRVDHKLEVTPHLQVARDPECGLKSEVIEVIWGDLIRILGDTATLEYVVVVHLKARLERFVDRCVIDLDLEGVDRVGGGVYE